MARNNSLLAGGVIVSSIVAGVIIGGIIANRSPLPTNTVSLPAVSPTVRVQNSIAVSPTPTPIPIGEPRQLRIPALGVDAAVETVGLDRVGNMDVPKVAANVAWYKFGARPGDTGNAVIAGHLDWTDGPAVFYTLKELKAGDEVTVTDAAEQTHTFRVTDQATYIYNQLPLNDIFGPHSESRLILITCEGRFDKPSQNYSHRTVVYAVKES